MFACLSRVWQRAPVCRENVYSCLGRCVVTEPATRCAVYMGPVGRVCKAGCLGLRGCWLPALLVLSCCWGVGWKGGFAALALWSSVT